MPWFEARKRQRAKRWDRIRAKELFVAAPGTGAYTRLCALQPLLKIPPGLELLWRQWHAIKPRLEAHRELLRHLLARLAIERLPLAPGSVTLATQRPSWRL